MSAPAPPHEGGTPWYAGGLSFHCTACGACCTGAPGYVWVEPEEIRAMAKARGLAEHTFRRRFVRRVKQRLSLRERKNGDCVMLGPDGRCTVYAQKPTRCSTFPFWPDALESPATWAETARRCEGIGQGPRYDRAEIERVAEGDPRPLLRRQAESATRAAAGEGDPAAGQGGPRWEQAFALLELLYAELDRELPRYRFTCAATGKCCDFDAYGHRLYATVLETEYFFRHAPSAWANDDPRQCPAWGPDRLCHAREARMLGCRVYFCGPYPVLPPDDVYERYHARIKEIHDRCRVPFAYRDIVAWAKERREARTPSPDPGP